MAGSNTLRVCSSKPRVFIITDIGNEPDDSESLVRYLVYANEFDTRGLVACTSTHIKSTVHPEMITNILQGYAAVVDNLNKHAHPENQYPSAHDLLDLVSTGPAVYGKIALAPDAPLSDGAALLIARVDESDHPLWVLGWGGINTLAQAVAHVDKTKSPEEAALFRSKLRVYTISDQDDTGAWLRTRFPDIFYICSIHGWCQYFCAAWTGISGCPEAGADPSQFTREWIRENVQIGPLGAKYPDAKFLVEGDSPTFLYLIQNGLGSPEHPHWGSWGGRYSYYDESMTARHYADAVDSAVGIDGIKYESNWASIWKWRHAFQNDFAARMRWTLIDDFGKANHAPVVVVNGSNTGPEPVHMRIEAGETVVLDASESYDPDGDALTFRWFQYREPTGVAGLFTEMIPDVPITDVDVERPGTKVKVVLPGPERCGIDLISGKAVKEGFEFHFVLEVTDGGTPSLTTYKRVVIRATNKDLRGGRATAVETNADWIELQKGM